MSLLHPHLLPAAFIRVCHFTVSHAFVAANLWDQCRAENWRRLDRLAEKVGVSPKEPMTGEREPALDLMD